MSELHHGPWYIPGELLDGPTPSICHILNGVFDDDWFLTICWQTGQWEEDSRSAIVPMNYTVCVECDIHWTAIAAGIWELGDVPQD